jgi:hypothetical protein
MSKIETFLKKIGVPADAISKLTAEDDTTPIEEIATSFKTVQRDVLKNDPEFIQPIKDEIRGSELSKIEHKLKKTFNLPSEEIKDKKFDEIISIAYDRASKATAQGAEEIQQRLIELSNENKRLLEDVIPAKELEAKKQITTFKRESIISQAIAKRQLIVSADVVSPAVRSYLDQNFNVDVDDNGQLVVKTKNNLNPLNQDGTKIVTFDEILDSHLTQLGVVKQSNGSPNNQNANPKGTPPNPANNGGNDGPKFQLAGLKKAQQNAESLANMKVFGQGSAE